MSARTPGAIARPVAAAPPPGLAGDWPFGDAIEVGPLPGAVPSARRHVRRLLLEWGLTRLAEDAELLVSELVTNAVAALRSAGQVSPARLWLLADRTRVLILVWDAVAKPPVPSDADRDAECGRGLQLVDAISQRWDWYLPQGAAGKVVWALAAADTNLGT
jgi:anti-sigma regulatory factor (Ser/Thr protein kinase)